MIKWFRKLLEAIKCDNSTRCWQCNARVIYGYVDKRGWLCPTCGDKDEAATKAKTEGMFLNKIKH